MHSDPASDSGGHFGVLPPEVDLVLTRDRRCTLEAEGPPEVHASLKLKYLIAPYILQWFLRFVALVENCEIGTLSGTLSSGTVEA